MISLRKYLTARVLLEIGKVLHEYSRFIEDYDQYLGSVAISNEDHIFDVLNDKLTKIVCMNYAIASIELNNDTETITIEYTGEAMVLISDSCVTLEDIVDSETVSFVEIEDLAKTKKYDLVGVASNKENDLLVRQALKAKGYEWRSCADLVENGIGFNYNPFVKTICYSLGGSDWHKTITYVAHQEEYKEIPWVKGVVNQDWTAVWIPFANVVFNSSRVQDNLEEGVEEPHTHCCEICGKKFDDEDLKSLGYHTYVCSDCEKEGFYCSRCGGWHQKGEEHQVIDRYGDSVTWCESCYTNHSFYCEGYGETYSDYYSYYYVNGHCYSEDYCENHFHWCEDCRNYADDEHWDFDIHCCVNCVENHSLVRDYHDNPYKVFYGDKPKNVKSSYYHIGIELEIDKSKQDVKQEIELIQALNNEVDSANDELYYEHDGSLDYGFEIITQPHTYESFMAMNWERILELCSMYDYKSHDTTTCGLHMHISREFFGRTKDEQDRAIAKLLIFFDRNYDEIVKVSRRKNDLNWCKKYFTDDNYVKVKLNEKNYKPNVYYTHDSYYNSYSLATSDMFYDNATYYKKVSITSNKDYTKKDTIELAKSETKKTLGHSDRYKAVNLTNRATIEFRIMKGTLNPTTFRACINFLYRVAMNSKYITFKNVGDNNLWLKGIDESTKAYLKTRNAFLDVISE